MNPYRRIFQALNEAGIRYLVVGGVAVNLHGHRRFTGDLDILLALDEENLQRMSLLMEKMGYTERLPITLKNLSNPKHVQQWIEEKGMTAYTFLSKDRLRLDIDVIVDASLQYESLDGKKVLINGEEDLTIPVSSIIEGAMRKDHPRTMDIHALRRSKEMSPGARLDWLAAALEFVRNIEKSKKK